MVVGQNNPGGLRTGQRYVAPHVGRFIGPLPPLRGPLLNRFVVAKQPLYRIHILVRAWIGPYAPLRGPLHNTAGIPLKQPPYRIKRLVQPWIGPYPALRGPLHNTLAVPLKQPAYVIHRLIRPWIGPYPPLRGPLQETLIRAKQPIVARPRVLHGVPIIAAPLQPPVGHAIIIRAKQPRYATHIQTRPWIGPYPPLRGPIQNRLAYIHQQPTAPRAHVQGFKPPTAVAPVGNLYRCRARQPIVGRPRPQLRPFTGYVPAQAPVPARRLLRTVRYTPARIHTLLNTAFIKGPAIVIVVPPGIPAFGICTPISADPLGVCTPVVMSALGVCVPGSLTVLVSSGAQYGGSLYGDGTYGDTRNVASVFGSTTSPAAPAFGVCP